MRSDDEIEALVLAFERGTLPRADWTHDAHLTVALWYLLQHDRAEATTRMRQGIQRFNLVQGNPNGYHETITLAWIAVIAQFVSCHDRRQGISHLARELIGECGDKHYLARFYSREVLMSDEARARWVPPDRRPIEVQAPRGRQPITRTDPQK